MIRVTHSFSKEPEVFDTTAFGVKERVLHIYDPSGTFVTNLFNDGYWAAVEAIPEAERGSL